MPKVQDWSRRYWRNASGERVYDPDEINPTEEVLCLYENDIGEQVGYRFATDQDDVEGEYVVIRDGEVVRDVELEGPNFEGEFDVLAFDTRAEAREACRDYREILKAVPSAEEIEDVDWQELLEIARPRGLSQRDGRETIQDELRPEWREAGQDEEEAEEAEAEA